MDPRPIIFVSPPVLDDLSDYGFYYFPWLDYLFGSGQVFDGQYKSYPEEAVSGQAISNLLPSNVMVPTPAPTPGWMYPAMTVPAITFNANNTISMLPFSHVGMDDPVTTLFAAVPVLMVLGGAIWGVSWMFKKRAWGRK
ncbi:uncharacterized protein AB675_891 [Cyphellophora attinorum]|uniref:Uncharacterized protein n=1 Tax=Cyphellophora attinorum TaxID=1664694 RepID=A0A0N0NS60_9EURO|nr:uncharacterized protein AB675_891 [Phialophora attinorum]KPI45881.1 hypothetical protein AB675_891 [Phialophora attinorum]